MTINKTTFFVTEVYTLRSGTELRRDPFGPLKQAPTQNELAAWHAHPLAHALAGDDQMILDDEPQWVKTDKEWTWDGDGGWGMELEEHPAPRGTGWFLRGPNDQLGTAPNLGTDLEDAFAAANAIIMNGREDPDDPDHYQETFQPRPHEGVLIVPTKRGPIVVPVDSIEYVSFDVTDSDGNQVDPKPGWRTDPETES